MKKLYLWIILALSITIGFWLNNSWSYYGTFGIGTSSTDSVFIAITTFDTLGQIANADSVHIITLWRGTLRVDSLRLASATRTGYYTTARRAVDSTTSPVGLKLGQYIVYAKWWINGGKMFSNTESYMVIDTLTTPRSGYVLAQNGLDSDTSFSQVQALVNDRLDVAVSSRPDSNNIYRQSARAIYDSTSTTQALVNAFYAEDTVNWIDSTGDMGYKIATLSAGGTSDSVTAVARVWNVLDKTNYQLASGQVVARADSVTGVGRLTTNIDKTGYSLSSQGQADIWTHDTTGENSGWAGFFKGRLDANTSSRFAPGDSGIIARAPWDNDLIAQANRRIQYVDSLGENITGSEATNPDTIANHVWSWNTRTLTSGAGSGSNQVTIYTLQSSDSIPISAVQVQVLNQNQTATEGLLTSNSLGQSVFALNDGIYKVRMFKPGWQFTVPESIIVSGNTLDTFYAEFFDPGTPPSAELCRTYGWVQDLKGQPVVGATIEAKISHAPLRYQTVLISPYYKTTTTDSDGYWYLDLYPNLELIPSDTKYDFTIYIPYGTILKLKATVPEESSWELVW